MNLGRTLANGLVFFAVTIAWLVLGGVTHSRKDEQSSKLRASVQSLWGNPQVQRAPNLRFRWTTQSPNVRTETKDGVKVQISELVTEEHERAVPLASSQIEVGLDSDLRRKGLMWYSLYDVGFDAKYHYVHEGPESGVLRIMFAFPDANAIYDRFTFTVNGVEKAGMLDPTGSGVSVDVSVTPSQPVDLHVAYASRGLDEWQYKPTEGVGRLSNFELNMRTNFRDIDFPAQTLSPSKRSADGEGHRLSWSFRQIVAGNGIGMVMPQRVQPGDLASQLAWSAPISLFFFSLVIFVLAILRKIEIHPINYTLLAGAFFAFHLLFAYSADLLPVEAAFALASVVSIALVVSYLRLVVSPRFALVEAGLSQLVYLVGFSLAHFWSGYTGLTTTVLAIITLYVLMQVTGRVRWSDVLGTRTPQPQAQPAR
jgi:inner membrane protein involved in colicin E2 resistance